MVRSRYFYKDDPDMKTAVFKEAVLQTVYNFKDIYDYLLVVK